MRLTGRTPRRALLLSSVGLLLCAGAVPAHGDPVAGPAFTLDQGTRALTMAGGADRAPTATATSRPQAAAPAAAPIAEIPGGLECPTGTTRVSTALTEGFEKGSVPEPIDTSHWSVVSGGARTGSYLARSVISASDPASQPTDSAKPYWTMAMPLVQVTGGRTVLRFAIKGSYGAETAYVAVNATQGWAAPSSTWGTVTLDVTDAVTAADAGWVDVRFANYPKVAATNSTIDIDDVEVYTCSAQSKTRGDFTGDKIADVVTVNAAGTLQVWPGRGDGRLSAPLSVGTGWGAMDWLGSPGDINGDGRADLMSRATNGNLYAYYGDGAGGFTIGSRLIGTGWQFMTSIIPMGDINGDGFFDVLACDVKGDLRRYYWTGPTSPLTGGTLVGKEFYQFKTLLSIGDYNSDGRNDVYGILPNGDLKVYTTLATGSLFGHGTRIGWDWFFPVVTSPGSFNGDSYSDVLGLDAKGNLWTYPKFEAGRWGDKILTGTSFNIFKLIL